MKLTRREALVRGGGLLGALGLGKFFSAPAVESELGQASITATEWIARLNEHNPILDDMPFKPGWPSNTTTFALQQSHNGKDWHDAAYYLCGPGMKPKIDRDHIDPRGGMYVRVEVKTS